MKQKRIFIMAVFVLGFLLSCAQGAEDQIPRKVTEKVKNATVQIKQTLAGMSMGGGSGFFVAPDLIVSNIHVVGIIPQDQISVINTNGNEFIITGIIGFDPEHDLVLLKVNPESEFLDLGTGKIDDQIFVAGFPEVEGKRKQEYEVKKGIIHNIWNKGRELRLAARVSPDKIKDTVIRSGFSGGPVVNHDGKVVGVSVGRHSHSGIPVDSFAASAIVLKTLLKNSESNKTLSFSDWQDKDCVRAYVLERDGNAKMEKAKSEKHDEVKAKSLYDDAIADFDKAAELCPNNADFHFKLGKARIFRNASDLSVDVCKTAMNSFTQAIVLNQDHYRAYYNRGIAHLSLGKLEPDPEKKVTLFYKSIYDLAEGIRFNPVDTPSYAYLATAKFHLAELEIKKRNKAEALSIYDKAIRDVFEVIKREPNKVYLIGLKSGKESKNAYVYYTEGVIKLILGQSMTSKGNVEEARNLYGEATSDFIEAAKRAPDDAGFYYDRAINVLNPSDADTYQMRGILKSLRGQTKVDREDMLEVREYYQSAVEDFEEAIKLYEKVVQENSSYIVSAAYGNLAYTKYLLGKSFETENEKRSLEQAQSPFNEAIDDSTKAIDMAQNNAFAYNARGAAKAAIEDYDGAIADLNKAIELNPEFAEAYMERGLVKQKIGQQQEADADFKKAKEWEYYTDGAAKAAIEDYDGAIVDLNEAIELNPEFAKAYYTRGAAKARIENHDGAIADLNKAIELNPKFAQAYMERGRVRQKIGQQQKAEADFEKAKELNPDIETK